MSEAILNIAPTTGEPSARLHGIAQGGSTEAVLLCTSCKTADLLRIEVEPASRITLIRSVLGMQAFLLSLRNPFRGVPSGQIAVLRNPFVPLRGPDLLVLRPLRILWSPVEAELRLTAQWVRDLGLAASMGDLCDVDDATLRGGAQWLTDAGISVIPEGAAVEVTAETCRVDDALLLIRVERPYADLHGTILTVRDIRLTARTHGGLTEADLRGEVLWWKDARLGGASQGNPSAGIRAKARRTDEASAELRIEVMARA